MASETEIGKLVIKLVADISDIKKQFGDVKGQLKDLSDHSKTHIDSVKGTFASMKDSIGGALGGMQTAINFIAANALVQLAQSLRATAQEIFSFMQMGARVIQIRESFESITKASGIMGQRLIADMKAASNDTIKETDLMVKAQRLIVEGFSAKEITAMTHAARIAARQMAIDVSEAFDLVTEAVLTGRTRGLRRAFPMEPEEVYRAYARNLGITVEALQENEKHWAILARVIEMDAAYVKKYGEPLESISENLQKQRKLWGELKEDISTKVTPAVQDFAGVVWKVLKAFGEGKLFLPLVIARGLVEKLPPPPEKLVSEHWTPEMETAAQKEADEKAGKERIKRNEAIGKALIQIQKDVAKAEEELVKITLEAERNIAVTAAIKRGQDTWVVERDFAIKAAQVRYDATIKSLEAEKAAKEESFRKETMTAEGLPLPREVQAKIDKEYYEKRKTAEAQLAAETTKIWLEQTKMVMEAYMKGVQAERGITPEMEPFAPTTKQIAEIEKQSRLYWIERDKADADFEKQLATITGDFGLMINAQVKSLEIEHRQYMESEAWAKLSLDQQKKYNDLMDLRKKKLQEVREIEKQQEKFDWAKKVAELTGDWKGVWNNEILALDAQRNMLLATKELTPETRDLVNAWYDLKKQEAEATKNLDPLSLAMTGVRKSGFQATQDVAKQFEDILPNAIDVFTNSIRNAGGSFKTFFSSLEQGFLKLFQDISFAIVKMEILNAVKKAGGIGGLIGSIFGGGGTPSYQVGGMEGAGWELAGQKGGAFWATKPTRILVGEGGQPEHISITPLSKMVPRGVFGPMGKSSELRSSQGFQGGGQIITVPWQGAAGAGGKPQKIQIQIEHNVNSEFFNLVARARLTSEEIDVINTINYRKGGKLYKAMKEGR